VPREQLLPESVPWLIANHKLEKAQSIIRRVFNTYYARLPASLSVRRQVMQTHCNNNNNNNNNTNNTTIYKAP